MRCTLFNSCKSLLNSSACAFPHRKYIARNILSAFRWKRIPKNDPMSPLSLFLLGIFSWEQTSPLFMVLPHLSGIMMPLPSPSLALRPPCYNLYCPTFSSFPKKENTPWSLFHWCCDSIRAFDERKRTGLNG